MILFHTEGSEMFTRCFHKLLPLGYINSHHTDGVHYRNLLHEIRPACIYMYHCTSLKKTTTHFRLIVLACNITEAASKDQCQMADGLSV